MPSFQHRIAKVVKGNYRHIEAAMRDRATLDFLSPEAFDQLAIECAPIVAKEPKTYEALALKKRLRVAPDIGV